MSRIYRHYPLVGAEVSIGTTKECERCNHLDDVTLLNMTENKSWEGHEEKVCQSAKCFPLWKQSIRKWWCLQCDKPLKLVRPEMVK